jgi:hypothetical protein
MRTVRSVCVVSTGVEEILHDQTQRKSNVELRVRGARVAALSRGSRVLMGASPISSICTVKQ